MNHYLDEPLIFNDGERLSISCHHLYDLLCYGLGTGIVDVPNLLCLEAPMKCDLHSRHLFQFSLFWSETHRVICTVCFFLVSFCITLTRPGHALACLQVIRKKGTDKRLQCQCHTIASV